MSLVSVTNLVKNYGKFRAIDDLDLELDGGRIVGLLGENGCGKTTLLKVLAGALADYEGDVRIDGHSPGPESKAVVSFLPDASFLPDGATLDACIRQYRDFFSDFSEDHARDLIGFFGLETGRRLSTLSKGMREKAQIALAMSRQAKVYLLDEPISGIDPAARDTILDTILRSYSPDALVIISTHLIADIEAVADTAVFLSRGRVLMAGDADDLRTEHGMSLDHLFRTTYATPVRS